MIGWLKGSLRQKSSSRFLVDTGGVGYEVFVTNSTWASYQTGEPVELHIHTHLREDGITLFGFDRTADKEVFLTLTSVSGVGPKTAMGILSAISADRLVDAIRTKNLALLQSTPGVGKKTAERLVVELRDKLKNFAVADSKGPIGQVSGATEEVLSALVNLGYKRPNAEVALSQVDLSTHTSFDKILRETLKILSV
jgi:holliday junction DNA helicase RuvA